MEQSYSARMQLPVMPKGSNDVDKFVVEFDFNEDSTGLDVVLQVMEQLEEDYVLWTGNTASGPTTHVKDPETLNQMIVVCKEAGLEQFTSIKESLLWRPATRKVFEQHLKKQAPDDRAPLFQLTTREKLRTAMEKQSTKGRSPNRKESPVLPQVPQAPPPIAGRGDEGGSREGTDDIAAPPAAILRPVPLTIPAGSPPSSSSLTPHHEFADSLLSAASDTRAPGARVHNRSARSPQENTQAETSFSTIHLAASSAAHHNPNGVSQASLIPSIQDLPALLDVAPCSLGVLGPELRALFGLPQDQPALLDWTQLVCELPIEQEFLDVAAGLQDASVQKWKELRAEVLPGRRHWIHRMASPPRRESWLKAMENEEDLLQQETAVLAQKRQDVAAALEAATRKRDQRLEELNSLQIAAVVASASLKKRDQLQQKYDDLRREATEFRDAEQELHRRVVEQLERTAKLKTGVSGESPPTTLEQEREHDTPRRNGDEQHDDVFFDEHHQPFSATRDLAFLSPSLRASVSDALRPGQGASPQSALDPDAPQQQTTELRRLATSLQDYLNSEGSPSASARADLLSQVRKAREAVESRRSLTLRSDSLPGAPAHSTTNVGSRSVVGSFVRHPVQQSSASFRGSSLPAMRQSMGDAARGPSTGSTFATNGMEATRYVDVHSFHNNTQPSSPHRYELGSGGPSSLQRGGAAGSSAFDEHVAAERAVPFFLQR
ncbi:Hypothetical protein, putative [Bodo saltans]|uniref:Uncharacterized protein n=1 Tax=Bodo saltans TaxID=75058 RepID=A0A0S4J6U8_BODSA|nr:Hypothetical protein, putative [Bodo saltans]|eukprot:CUG87182.1 Hypothetical protein, putative [Bodo saltans]